MPKTAKRRSATAKQSPSLAFLHGNSAVTKLLRHHDWSASPLGLPETWSPTLKSTVAMLLPADVQIVLFWGKNYCALYNDAYAPTIGNKHPQALGQPARQHWSETWDDLQPLLDEVWRTGKTVSAKDRQFIIERHGYPEQVYFDISYSPIRNEVGVIEGVLCIVNETTERVQANEREQRFRTLIEQSADAIQLISAEGKVLYSSDSVKHVTGFTPDEIKGQTPATRLHPDDLPLFQARFKQLLKHPDKPQTLRYRVKHKNGQWVWLETTGTNHLKTPNINALVGNFRNITERMRAEAELRESEARFRALANNIQNLAWLADPDGRVFWCNQRWHDYTGVTEATILAGKWRWQDSVPPGEATQIVHSIGDCWRQAKAWELTFPFKRHDGQFRLFLARAEPVTDKDGRIERWIGTSTDIEDLHKRQEAERRNQLLTEQRNALVKLNKTKDEFIGLASHQLRTPATAVKQYLGLILSSFSGPLNNEQTRYLQIAYDSNERELTVINDLLKTAQLDTHGYQLHKRSTELRQLVRRVAAELQPSYALRDQTIRLQLPRQPLKASIDPVELALALANLLENASKYSPDSSRVTVHLVRRQRAVELNVSDQGVGIRKADQQRIFEKFSRASNPLSTTVDGSGLGLYWVKQIAKLHGGSISLESTLRRGSTFTIRLPLR